MVLVLFNTGASCTQNNTKSFVDWLVQVRQHERRMLWIRRRAAKQLATVFETWVGLLIVTPSSIKITRSRTL